MSSRDRVIRWSTALAVPGVAAAAAVASYRHAYDLVRAWCTFLSQYAAKNKVSHPSSVYLREEQLLPKIAAWLSRKFDPIAFTAAVRELEAAHPDEQEPDEGAQREIAACDAKLARHRAARCRSSPGE